MGCCYFKYLGLFEILCLSRQPITNCKIRSRKKTSAIKDHQKTCIVTNNKQPLFWNFIYIKTLIIYLNYKNIMKLNFKRAHNNNRLSVCLSSSIIYLFVLSVLLSLFTQNFGRTHQILSIITRFRL